MPINLSRARAWLNSTKLQVSSAQDFNQAALYQTIKSLIDQIDVLQKEITTGTGSSAATIQNINQITQILDSFEGNDGVDGEMGPPGIIGPIGPSGPTGSIGPMGIPGIDGIDGDDGYPIPGLPGSGSGGSSDHNSLSGLQGGTASEYYHLTSSEYSNLPLKNIPNIFTGSSNAFIHPILVDEGIEFPATAFASAIPNILDDYEEGSWTPIDASGAGLTFTGVAASYVKIGKLVMIRWELRYPSTTNSSVSAIGNLPFVIGTSSAGAPGVVSTTIPMYFYINAAANTINPIKQAGGMSMLNSDLSLAFLWGSGFYFV